MILLRLFLFALILPHTAYGQCIPTTFLELEPKFERANEALNTDDLIGHGTAVRRIKSDLTCLNERLPAVPWSEFLVGIAIVEYTLGREWTSYLDTAYRININLTVNYGPPDIRQHLPRKAVTEVRSVRDDAEYFLDGLPLSEVGNLPGLHIAQRRSDAGWETRVLDDEPFPDDWLVPETTSSVTSSATSSVGSKRRPNGRGLLLVGSSVTAAGALGVGTTFAMSRTIETPSSAQVETLIGLNLGSWGVTLVGAGLATTGVVLGRHSSSGFQFAPNGITFRGTFQ